MQLSEYLDGLAYEIAFWLAAFQDADYALEKLGDVSVEVTANLRTAAIIALLAHGDSDTYFHNLIRSARCRIAYLHRLREAGITNDHHQGSGRVGPFLDAVAAADFGSARKLVALSPTEWMQGHEYEDHYCYAQIVHGLITMPTDVARLGALLDRYDSVLEGGSDERLEVARVLVHRDRDAFEPAFEALLAQRTRQIDADKARHRIVEPPMMAERQIYVEGLALLQIATRLRFRVQAEYEYCPSLALVPMRRPFPGE